MKKRKRSFFQQITVWLLCIAMIAGTITGGDSISVYAQENTALYDASAAGDTRDVTFTYKVYGYNDEYALPDDMSRVTAIWKVNGAVNSETGEAQAVGQREAGYSFWKYLFKGLEEGKDYGVQVEGAPGQIGSLGKTGTEFEVIAYAVNFYDGNELKGVLYAKSGYSVWEDSAPALAKDGYSFAGWVTADGGKDAFDFSNTITQITNVYASWTPDAQSDTDIASGDGWTLAADGTLIIASNDGVVKWKEDAGGWLQNRQKVTALELGSGVTTITASVFSGCTGLTEITIPGTVTSIGKSAFATCTGLTEITIPNTVTSIGSSTFSGCSSLTSVTLPDNMTSIGESMFRSCSSLTSITLPESVTSIGENAFNRCGKLQEITIPKAVADIGITAFENCLLLENITFLGDTPPKLGNSVFGADLSSPEMGERDGRCGFVKNGTQGIHVPEGRAQTYKDAETWADWAAYIANDAPTPPAEEHKHNDVTFTAWTATDSLPDTAGDYYLTENVTLSATWNVPSGETTLCLNGKTISASGTDKYRVITIPNSCTLNLYDCQNAGNITGGKSGGVRNIGTFCMYGGKISGNSAAYAVAGVYNGNTFYMYGGEISGNTAEEGVGGVETYGKFSMYGGKIRNNERNSSRELGGGGVRMNGGGSFTVGGSAVISENTCNGKEDNVCLDNRYDNSQLITIDSSNPLSDSANIGVTSQAAPTDGNPVNITGENSADYSSFFTSDNADYEIVNGGNNVVQLALKTLPDTQPPTGKIEIDGNSWTNFTSSIIFRLFFREAKQVTITAQDEDSGVDKIYYYISSEELDGGKAELDALEADKWTEGSSFSIAPDKLCIIYVKITDKAGNITYLSSDGVVFDATPPVISGVMDGGIYNAPQTVTVTDAMFDVKRVTVNGTEVPLTDTQFTLGLSDSSQTIVAEDLAGNTAIVTVIVNAQTQSYAVTVHNGTGTGIYRAGDTVEITANAPSSGKQFDEWQVGRGGVTLADATSSTTTFTMPERDVEIEAVYKDITEEHTHNYGDWQHDDTQHWKVCACGEETGRGNHDFGDWITEREATETEAGTKYRECQTCGCRQTEAIPATGGGSNPGSGDNNSGNGSEDNIDSGDNNSGNGSGDNSGGSDNNSENDSGNDSGGDNNISNNNEVAYNPATAPVRVNSENQGNIYKEVTVKAEDTFNAVIATTVSELADIVLTQEEKQLAAGGSLIKIVLDMQDAQNTVSAADRAVVESVLNTDAAKGFVVGQYLDVNLFKIINEDRSVIHETNGKITVTIAVPDRLKNTDADKTRTFAVIRIHDGVAEVLTDMDNSNDTITIATDRFSTYAIIYKDTAGSSISLSAGDSSNNASNDTKDSEPKTGDNTHVELYATLAMISGLAYLLIYFADSERGMSEETKKELVAAIIGWAKRGGGIRRRLALAAIFILLVYYHSIGKKACVEWKEVCGE